MGLMYSLKAILILASCCILYGYAAPSIRTDHEESDVVVVYRDSDIRRNPFQSMNFWTNKQFKWPKGIIPYTLSPSYTSKEKGIINAAMSEWQEKTCLKFVQRSNQKDYIEITPNDGTSSYCYSSVGRQGGKQLMKMFGECLRHPAMVHELGHAIGFNHEHQRPDRDNFINVHLENVQPAYHYAFDKYSTKQVDNMGTRYDYKSVMHYPFHAFTTEYNTNKPAMTLKDGSIDAIKREAEHLSSIDIEKTMLYYNKCK